MRELSKIFASNKKLKQQIANSNRVNNPREKETYSLLN